VSRDPRPTFTFAHFTLPHDPYVFDASGAFVPPSRSRPIRDAYLEQLRYTNSLIDRLVDQLLTGDPARDPIVILQSDEGPHPIDTELDRVRIFDWPREPQRELERKMKILMAYHLPGEASGPLPTRTPVNTFRSIFNRYFGARLELLPDRAFIYLRHDRPYRFRDVSERLGLTPA
jgi:membrane-anchored protein YejM (alkaline phosphatase superfamily)